MDTVVFDTSDEATGSQLAVPEAEQGQRLARCFARYRHTLRMAYQVRGMTWEEFDETLPDVGDLAGLSPEDTIQVVFPTIRRRLAKLSLTKNLLPVAQARQMELLGKEVVWPIINQQGLEWYGSSPLENYDFVGEHAVGLHDGARVIYDFGGHHGIWALYYALVVGEAGRVYTFEPSIINIEVSALLFLANQVSQVVNVAAAIGTTQVKNAERKMLVDFVDNNSIEIVNLRDVCWDYADFLKMDIEGFEYEILTEHPWVFDLATNMHIEVHIPHLESRGLDYRKIMDVIPFDKFEVFNHTEDNVVTRETQLAGFCSLMMRRKA